MRFILTLSFLIAIIFFTSVADQITGTVDNGEFFDFVVLSPKVCDTDVWTILVCFSPPCDFTLEPPSGCTFCHPDTDYDYWLTVVHDDGDTIHEPGEPISLYGPFDVDPTTCDYAIPEPLHKDTIGGFEGTIYNATKTVPIDSIMINIYHHYIGGSSDTFIYETTLAPMNLTPIGGGNYTYRMEGISSGGKRVEFFSDANGNGVLDPGELATTIDREIPITGNQYDDSVDVDLTMLSIISQVPKPCENLISAYPNPFNTTVEIRCGLVLPGEKIIIRDILGRTVKTLVASDKTIWDGTNNAGRSVSTGLYFITLSKSSRGGVKLWLIR